MHKCDEQMDRQKELPKIFTPHDERKNESIHLQENHKLRDPLYGRKSIFS